MSFNLNKLVQPQCGAPNPLVAASRQITAKPHMPAPRVQVQSSQLNLTHDFLQQQQPAPHSSGLTTFQASNPSASQFAPNPLRQYAANALILNPAATTSKAIAAGKLATDFLAELSAPQPAADVALAQRLAHSMNYQLHLNSQQQQQQYGHSMQQQQQQTDKTSAGDQLEEKYRNDLISQERNLKQHQEELQRERRLDDTQFWQSLAQSYFGPTTTTAADQELLADADPQQTAELLAAKDDYSTEAADLDYTFTERNPFKDQHSDPFAEGLKKLEQGDIPSAVLLFELAVQEDRNNSVAWRYLGTTQAQNEKDRFAIKALENCLKINDDDLQAHLALAVSYANEHWRVRACNHLLKWLTKNERYNTSILDNMEEFERLCDGSLMAAAGGGSGLDVDNSEYIYEYVRDKFVEAAQLAPTNNLDPDVQNSLGVLFNMQGNYEKALDCFKAALSVRSGDSLLWNRLGATLANSNQSEEAVIAYQRALAISPGFLRSRYNLAISLIHLNQYTEAGRQLIQILNMQAAARADHHPHAPRASSQSLTSASIWNTLRTVTTLSNKPELYKMIDDRDLAACNQAFNSNSGRQAAPEASTSG